MLGSSGMAISINGSIFDRFLHHYDQSAFDYWLLSGTASALFILVVLIGLFAAPKRTSALAWSGAAEPLFLLSVAVTLLAGRWPYLCFRHYFNPDESQQIAGAITLSHDPHFWLSVDGHTAGPVDFYYLSSPAFWGGAIDYTSARGTALLLVFGTLYFCYRILKLKIPTPNARLAMAPLVFFFSWVTDEDFVEISTEHMPVFLIAAGTYFFLIPILKTLDRRKHTLSWFSSGILIGLAPWAKLQASVTAVAFLVSALGYTFQQTPLKPFLQRLRGFVPFAIGLALPTCCFVAMMTLTGQSEAFYRSYLAANLDYTYRGTAKFYILNQFWEDACVTGFFPVLFLLTMGWLAGGLFYARRKRTKSSAALKWISGYVVVSFLTVLSPGRPFLHYLLFMIPALGVLAAFALNEPFALSPRPQMRRRIEMGFLASFLIFFLVARLYFPVPFAGTLQTEWNRPLSPPAQVIKNYFRPGDSIALWGWRPDVYVELQSPQGVRDAHTQRETEDTPFRPYYRARYLADLEKNRPLAFVDVVGPDAFVFLDRKRFGFEIFPELKDYVVKNYVLMSDTPIGRVFIRKDRL